MPITYTVDAEAGLLLIKWSGRIAIEDLNNFTAAIVADARIAACRRAITDVRGSEVLLTGEELRVATERLFAGAKARGRNWRTAVVVEKPMHFGVARQHEMVSADLKATGVFTDETAARAWVMAD